MRLSMIWQRTWTILILLPIETSYFLDEGIFLQLVKVTFLKYHTDQFDVHRSFAEGVTRVSKE